MKHLILNILLLFLILNTNGQNLVLDGSFEDTIKCAEACIECDLDPFLHNWTNARTKFSRPAYFNICSTDPFTMIPSNGLGYQDTCDGNGYISLMSYFYRPSTSNNPRQLRNYATGSLIDTMSKNKCYRVSFKYSLAETSMYAIKNFGIYFSDSIPYSLFNVIDYPFLLPHDPQIVVNQWMNNMQDWVKIERFFLAQGGEQYFTFGNFSGNDSTDTLFVKSNIHPPHQTMTSFLYLDDFVIEEVPFLSLPQLNLGSDTILCKGEQITFDSLLPNNPIYVWNNLVVSSDSSFIIDSAGTYWVEAYNGCSYTTDTINIEFVEPKVDLGNDTTLCKREMIMSDVTPQHEKLELLWNTGDTTNFISANGDGLYWLNAIISHCEGRDSINIQNYIPDNSVLQSKELDTTFCVSGILDASSTVWNDTYLWNTEEETQTIEVTETGTYSVYAENECTEATSTFNVKVESLEEGLNNYNIFSPNGDFINDLFTIYEGNSEEYQIQIFNRWGKLVWSSDEPSKHWDGSNVSDGNYFYHLSFRNCAGETIEQKGSVEVRR